MTKNSKLICFIPCRKGSERVINKNTRPFATYEKGLLELKMEQVSRLEEFDRVLISSNDMSVLDFTAEFSKRDPRFEPIPRPDNYGSSSTSMGDFIKYIAELVPEGTMLWTHVTHPFLTSEIYREIIAVWNQEQGNGHDSLVTVTPLHKFIWDENGPYNYDNTIEKWPRSQDLKPLFEINHGVYIMNFARMRELGDRIGMNPFLYKLPESVALDVDWEDQFNLLNDIALARLRRGTSLL